MYTSVLLCIYMHRVCGTISRGDHSAMLSWCKACITKNIHKFYHKFYLKVVANANDTIPCAICWSHAYAAGNVLLVYWLARLLAGRLPMLLLAGPTGAAVVVPLVRLKAAAVATTMQCGCGMQDAAETGHPTADCATNEGHDRDMGCRPNGHAMLHEHDDWCNCQS